MSAPEKTPSLFAEFVAAIFGAGPREHFSILRQDAGYAWRRMRAHPGFTAIVVLTLALGIGANTAIFSVVDTVLLSELPYRDGDQLVVLQQPRRTPPSEDIGFSPKELIDLRQQNRSLQTVVEYHSMSFILLGGEEPWRVQTGVVSWDFFSVFGVQPLLGRHFLPSDEQEGAEAVLMLSHDFWATKFRGDKSVVGRVLQMNNRPHTIIGVLPAFPQYPNENDVYMPSTGCPFRSSEQTKSNRAARMVSLFGRMKSGLALPAARSDLQTVGTSYQSAEPALYRPEAGIGVTAQSLREELTRTARPTFLILLGTVGFVLLIACANVANLTLSRVIHRERELAIRSAMGASRARIVRQLLTESGFLALAGGALGLVLASLVMDLLVKFAQRFTPRAGEIELNSTVLLFTLGISLFTGVIFGLLPAISAGREVGASLKEGGRTTMGRHRHSVRNVLIVAQVALSVVLLVGAGLMLRSLFNLLEVNPGYRPENVISARLTLNFSRYNTQEKFTTVRDEILRRAQEIPGITSAALGTMVPLSGQQAFQRSFHLEGQPIEEGTAPPTLVPQSVSHQYFSTLGIPVLRGRVFTADDRADSVAVAVINQAMARRYWGQGDPVGQRVTLDRGQNWVTIVGVVGDVRNFGLDREPAEEFYRPITQLGALGRLLIRSQVPPAQMAESVRAMMRSIDPDNPIDQVRTLADYRSESMAAPRLTAILLGIFAALALVITAAGIFGMMALAVSQRTHEIGIRMALGATPASVKLMVLRQGMVLVLAGLAVGVAGALGQVRVMRGLLFGVPPADPLTFVAVAGLLTLVASLACFLPARRAAATDPIIALRYE